MPAYQIAGGCDLRPRGVTIRKTRTSAGCGDAMDQRERATTAAPAGPQVKSRRERDRVIRPPSWHRVGWPADGGRPSAAGAADRPRCGLTWQPDEARWPDRGALRRDAR